MEFVKEEVRGMKGHNWASLSTGQEVQGSIPGSAIGFSIGEMIPWYVRTAVSVSQCPLSMFCSVLSLEESLHSGEHRSVEALQLCPCSYLWSI